MAYNAWHVIFPTQYYCDAIACTAGACDVPSAVTGVCSNCRQRYSIRSCSEAGVMIAID